MAAPKGSQYWKLRKTHGHSFKIEKPEEMWNKAVEYFEWAESNPLNEYKPHNGELVAVPKPRVLPILGLCNYIGICRQTFYSYKEREGFEDVIGYIDQIIQNNKFELAAADLINAQLIGKDLGLLDRQEISGPNGGAVQHTWNFQPVKTVERDPSTNS